MFFRSPVVLGILTGLAANALGVLVSESVKLLNTVESIAHTASLITVPLISIIIGYSFTVGLGEAYIAAFALADAVRPESREASEQLHAMELDEMEALWQAAKRRFREEQGHE